MACVNDGVVDHVHYSELINTNYLQYLGGGKLVFFGDFFFSSFYFLHAQVILNPFTINWLLTTGLPDGPQYMPTDPMVLNCKMNNLLKVAACFVVPAWEGDPFGSGEGSVSPPSGSSVPKIDGWSTECDDATSQRLIDPNLSMRGLEYAC